VRRAVAPIVVVALAGVALFLLDRDGLGQATDSYQPVHGQSPGMMVLPSAMQIPATGPVVPVQSAGAFAAPLETQPSTTAHAASSAQVGGPLFASPPMAAAQDPTASRPGSRIAPQQPTSGPAPEVFASAQIIARIGTETILASDILPLAEEALNQQLGKMTKEQREAIAPEEFEKTRWLYVQKILEQLIETKMKYADAVSNIPKERLPDIKTSVNESFEKTRLKSLLEKYGAANRSELESKMAAAGQSLDRQRQLYFEAAMAASWENQHVNRHKEIPVSQVLGYYQQHIADFEFPARARWEQLMANFDHFSSRPEAYRALCDMGNEVLRGADFATVAKARSHGPTAIKGGQYDWTSRGGLVSKEIDAAIFSLPPGRMSQIIEDDKGFHIVRVIERTDAGRKPFLEAQVEIRDKLREESINAQKDEFLAKIKARLPVWTVFGDANEGEEDSGETVGNRTSIQPR
jgi:parvulin-like peptidyl-prolyl isomerase